VAADSRDSSSLRLGKTENLSVGCELIGFRSWWSAADGRRGPFYRRLRWFVTGSGKISFIECGGVLLGSKLPVFVACLQCRA
jgi:hypothetical protein